MVAPGTTEVPRPVNESPSRARPSADTVCACQNRLMADFIGYWELATSEAGTRARMIVLSGRQAC